MAIFSFKLLSVQKGVIACRLSTCTVAGAVKRTLLCVCSCGDTEVLRAFLLLLEPWRAALAAPQCWAARMHAAASNSLPEEFPFQEMRQKRVRHRCIIIMAVKRRKRKDRERWSGRPKVTLRSQSHCKELNPPFNLRLRPRTHPQISVLNHTNLTDLQFDFLMLLKQCQSLAMLAPCNFKGSGNLSK